MREREREREKLLKVLYEFTVGGKELNERRASAWEQMLRRFFSMDLLYSAAERGRHNAVKPQCVCTVLLGLSIIVFAVFAFSIGVVDTSSRKFYNHHLPRPSLERTIRYLSTSAQFSRLSSFLPRCIAHCTMLIDSKVHGDGGYCKPAR